MQLTLPLQQRLVVQQKGLVLLVQVQGAQPQRAVLARILRQPNYMARLR